MDPAVAMDTEGDFVVAWESFGEDGGGYGVYAQRYNSSGTAQGTEFAVNQTTDGWQMTPDAAMAANGNFIITWAGYNTVNSTYDIFARMYFADGADYSPPALGRLANSASTPPSPAISFFRRSPPIPTAIS